MASLSGTSTASASGSGSDGEHRATTNIDDKKKRRMESNRESARRSRMRKQRHLDGLASQVSKLRSENYYVMTALNRTTQGYLTKEAENSVLRMQVAELASRLQSLNEILYYMNAPGGVGGFQVNALMDPVMAATDLYQCIF